MVNKILVQRSEMSKTPVMQDAKEIPHLIIKKVAKVSQKHMEEFVKQFGNVDQWV